MEIKVAGPTGRHLDPIIDASGSVAEPVGPAEPPAPSGIVGG
jgi:hypothetical protein